MKCEDAANIDQFAGKVLHHTKILNWSKIPNQPKEQLY